MTKKSKMYRKKGRALFLSVIMILSVIALSSAFAGSAAAAVDEAGTDRIINGGDTTVTNGTTVTVTVNGAFDQSISNATLLDTINGQGINDSEVEITDTDGGLGTLSSDPTVFVNYDTTTNLPLNSDSFTVTYNVTIPQDTPVGTTINFNGTVIDRDESPIDNASVGGDTQIEVVQQQPPTATVTFNDKTVQNGSTSVDVANATFNGTEPFNVVVHQASDDNDDGTIQASEIGKKIGESGELDNGTQQPDISVNISKEVANNDNVSQLTANQTLVAMLHTTNTNDGDNIVHTAPIRRGGTPVFDQAEITVSTVTVGGQEVPIEFTSETASGERTVTSDDAVDAIRAFLDPDRDVDSDTAVTVIRAFLQS